MVEWVNSREDCFIEGSEVALFGCVSFGSLKGGLSHGRSFEDPWLGEFFFLLVLDNFAPRESLLMSNAVLSSCADVLFVSSCKLIGAALDVCMAVVI
ncbi:hypothetical protein L1887_34441 [Cichorium endivia]|nr:hypothetical protein L1887_34441 [Cichorium endivia]